MPRTAAIGTALPLAAVLFLVGCSGGGSKDDAGSPASAPPTPSDVAAPSDSGAPETSTPAEPSGSASTDPATPSATAAPLTVNPDTGESVRADAGGRVTKELGQAGVLTESDGKGKAFSISITSVKPVKTCTMRGFGDELEPERGQFLNLDVSAKMGSRGGHAAMSLGADSFVPLDSDGKPLAKSAFSDAAEACDAGDPLDILLPADTSSTGHVMLDIPADTAAVAFDPDGTPGWVWSMKG